MQVADILFEYLQKDAVESSDPLHGNGRWRIENGWFPFSYALQEIIKIVFFFGFIILNFQFSILHLKNIFGYFCKPLFHFIRGLVGEGHCQDPVDRNMFASDQVGNLVCQHSCLSASSSGNNQAGRIDMQCGLGLLFIEFACYVRLDVHIVAGQNG